jgi:hypothetical protein
VIQHDIALNPVDMNDSTSNDTQHTKDIDENDNEMMKQLFEQFFESWKQFLIQPIYNNDNNNIQY